MKNLNHKDLKDTFIAIVHQGKGRPMLPVIRRYFRSIKNQCLLHVDRHVEIYFEGVLLATKKPHAKRLEYDREFADKYEERLIEVMQ